jgi:hypothetical protein
MRCRSTPEGLPIDSNRSMPQTNDALRNNKEPTHGDNGIPNSSITKHMLHKLQKKALLSPGISIQINGIVDA